VSPAGLVGSSRKTDGGWESTPGQLPKAAGGVAILQDAHGWSRSSVLKIAPILQGVMEDGVVRDSVSGGKTRPASVSLLIDLNRGSQVSTGMSEAALISVRPLLSRFDTIIEIDPQPGRIWDVAAAVAEKLGPTKTPAKDETRERELKVLVALLRERFAEVDTSAVQPLVAETIGEIRAANPDLLANPSAGDIPVRLGISLTRLVVASARACGRSVATLDDLARARKLINHKLDFLKLVGVGVDDLSSCPRGDRRAWVATQAREPVQPNQLAKAWKQLTGESVSDRTIIRDLEFLGATRTSKGKYQLFPANDTMAKSEGRGR
jgi:hypothetical protein